MAYSYVGGVSVGSTGGGTVTSGSFDSSGAELLVIVLSDYAAAGRSAVSDSKSNTWVALTESSVAGNMRNTLFYAKAATVGSGHTVTATVGAAYPAVALLAFAGSDLTAPFDQENGATGVGVTTKQPGSVTPGSNDELIVHAMAVYNAALTSITSTITLIPGLTITSSPGNHFGLAVAYDIQTTATATNPTFAWSGSSDVATRIATFKAGAGGAPVGQPTMRRWDGIPGLGGPGVKTGGGRIF